MHYLKVIILIIFIFVLNIFIIAQTDSSAVNSINKPAKISFQTAYGVQICEISKLNSSFLNKYPAIKPMQFSADFGVNIEENRFVFMAYLFVSQQSQSSDSNNVNFKITGISGNIGHIIINKRNFYLYPFIGLSETKIETRTSDNLPTQTVSNYFSGTSNSKQINSTQSFVNIGFQTNFLLNVSNTSKRKIIIGLRSGYNFPFTKTIWTISSMKLKENPNINSGGLYFKVLLGLI